MFTHYVYPYSIKHLRNQFWIWLKSSKVGSLLSHGSLLVAFPLRRHGPAAHRATGCWTFASVHGHKMSSTVSTERWYIVQCVSASWAPRTSCGSWDLPVSWCGAPLTSAPYPKRSEGLAGPGALLEVTQGLDLVENLIKKQILAK